MARALINVRKGASALSELNERIKEIIQAKGMKKTAFAERLNVSQAFVSQMCSGTSQPSDRTISDICREFNVSEDWLRTGEGEMFIKRSKDEELSAFFGDLLAGQPDFKRRLISVLSRLNKSEWELLERMADKLMDEMQKEKADP